MSQKVLTVPSSPLTGTGLAAYITDAVRAISSNQRGATEPPELLAGMLWDDTSTGLLKKRNSTNTGWITLGASESAYLGLAQQTVIQTNGYTSGAATGSSGAYVLTVTPAITAYTPFNYFAFSANHATPGASTLAVSGLAAKTIKKFNNAGAQVDTVAADIPINKIVNVIYDSVADTFILINPALNTLTSLTASVVKMTSGVPSAASPGTDYQAPLAFSSNYLTADVTMTSANTPYDGPSLSLVAGTYYLSGQITITAANNGTQTVKLWDGSTVISSTQAYQVTNSNNSISIAGFVTLATTTTIKITALADFTGAVMRATPTINGTGCTNTASYLLAIKK